MSQSKNISWYFKKQQCLLGYTITSSYKWIQLAGKNIFEKKIQKLEKEVFKISKKEFNIASPKQLGEIIYNDLKIAGLKKPKKEVLQQVQVF